jgi:glucose/arabinose dehydrogenase
MRRQSWGVAVAVAVAASAGAQTEATTELALTAELVVDGLDKPLLVTAPPGDLERLFILEQDGRIRIVREGSLLAAPFLDIEPLVSKGNEQGLLGLAFSPDYEADGEFYIYYTDLGDTTIVARYVVSGDPDVADPASAETLLTQAQPGQRHNAGWMGFGLDRMLYIALGDGGPAGGLAAQDRSSLLGSMLRIDVLGPPDPGLPYAVPGDNPFVGMPGARGEIWAWGLRNPWRDDIDPETGDLWIADVGWLDREEINFQPSGGGGGENYGWWCREGSLCLITSGACPSSCDPSLFAEPIHEYDHTVGHSITGGVVYRGCAMPELSGGYFFGDFALATIWSLRYDGVTVTEFTDRTAELTPGGGRTIDLITSFGRDGYGEMYVCDRGGEIFRVVPRLLKDCNDNGIADGCDIAVGTSLDENEDGIPDECQCRADLTSDGELDFFDFLEFQNLFAAGDLRADFTGDGELDFFDFLQFQNEFAAGCV